MWDTKFHKAKLLGRKAHQGERGASLSNQEFSGKRRKVMRRGKRCNIKQYPRILS